MAEASQLLHGFTQLFSSVSLSKASWDKPAQLACGCPTCWWPSATQWASWSISPLIGELGERLHPWTWPSGSGKCGSAGLHAGAGSVRKVNGYHPRYSSLVSLSVFLRLITLTPNSLLPSPLAGYLCSFPAFISSQHHPKCKAKLYCKISCYKMW